MSSGLNRFRKQVDFFMEALKQIIFVPQNHQIHLDFCLPKSIPTGEVEIVIVVSPKTARQSRKAKLLKCAGSLANSGTFTEDGLTIQRKLRDEWN